MLPDMLPDALLPHPLLRNATLRDGCAQTLQTCAEGALHMLSGIVEAVLTDALSTALGEADPSRLPHDANPSVMLAAAASLLFDVRDLQPPETASERDQAALHRAALALAAHRSDDARAAFSAADWAAGMCLPDKLPWPELLRQAWLLGWRHLIAHWVQPERASLAELGALIEGARAHGGPTDADADAILAEAGRPRTLASRGVSICASWQARIARRAGTRSQARATRTCTRRWSVCMPRPGEWRGRRRAGDRACTVLLRGSRG